MPAPKTFAAIFTVLRTALKTEEKCIFLIILNQ